MTCGSEGPEGKEQQPSSTAVATSANTPKQSGNFFTTVPTAPAVFEHETDTIFRRLTLKSRNKNNVPFDLEVYNTKQQVMSKTTGVAIVLMGELKTDCCDAQGQPYTVYELYFQQNDCILEMSIDEPTVSLLKIKEENCIGVRIPECPLGSEVALKRVK
jgi:hypothetical protein